MEHGIERSQIINELNRSAHGKLDEYKPIIENACVSDPEFVAKLICHDAVKGQIKDSKIALPVISIAHPEFPDDLVENSLAHLALQPPRELLKAIVYFTSHRAPHRRQEAVDRMVWRYLKHKEQNQGLWHTLAARHRRAMKSLYKISRCKTQPWVGNILFKRIYPPGSAYADISRLRDMTPEMVASTIQKHRLSPLIVGGALWGKKEKSAASTVTDATMAQMSDTQLVTRAKSLERKGVATDEKLKSTFRARVAKAATSKKATLKTSVAAEAVEDESMREMLKELQERQISNQKSAGLGIDGNWQVIVDVSTSQEVAIGLGVQIAAVIGKFVTGNVHIAFCNDSVRVMDATGKTLDQIQAESKYVRASGSTSYGVGLDWAIQSNLDLDGVVIVGDGGENCNPLFADRWREYKRRHNKELAVYLYQTYCPPQHANHPGGSPKRFANQMEGISFTTFDLTHGNVDYYALPNLVQQMRVNRFSLVDQIMACKLVTLDEVLPLVATAKG